MFGIDDFLIGAAVSGGSSLISGLFGRSGAKKRAAEEVRRIEQANRANRDAANEMNRKVRARADKAAKVPIVTKQVGQGNLSAMVADAIKNGFNPLTVLRSGGQAYYAGSTTTVTGSTAMDAALAGQHIATMQPLISQTQVPSTGEVFGKALENVAGSITSMMNTNQAQKFQFDFLAAQIAGANQNSLYNHTLDRLFATPSIQTSGSVFKDGSGGLVGWGGGSGSGGGMYPGAAGLIFENSIYKEAKEMAKNAGKYGATSNSLSVYPWQATPQQTIENEYGEWADIEGGMRWIRERGWPALQSSLAGPNPAQAAGESLGQWYRDSASRGADAVLKYLTTGSWMPGRGHVYGGAQ